MGSHSLLQGNLPDPGIESASLRSPALADGFFTTNAAWVFFKKREGSVLPPKVHEL